MPELPEVETIKRGLNKALIGQSIRSVVVRAPKLMTGNPEQLIGQKVLEIERRAKLLIWRLEKNYLLVHLKMTGQLIFVPNGSKSVIIGGHPDKAYLAALPHKHSHIIIQFDHGTLYFNDLRKFGWLKVVDQPSELKAATDEYGPEYDWPEYSPDYLKSQLRRRAKPTIKQLLLEQSLVAGLGNIYADETLFCAKIHPQRSAISLTDAEIETLYCCIPQVLENAVRHGGSSSKDYRAADGSLGTYLNVANVYKREGLPCKVCDTPIKRVKIAGRSSHFCPNCQQ